MATLSGGQNVSLFHLEHIFNTYKGTALSYTVYFKIVMTTVAHADAVDAFFFQFLKPLSREMYRDEHGRNRHRVWINGSNILVQFLLTALLAQSVRLAGEERVL